MLRARRKATPPGFLSARGLLYRVSEAARSEQPLESVESIVQNLRAVLNSDRGISASAPGLGLSLHRCMQDWDSDREFLLETIAHQIEAYEPRLTDVRVTEAARGEPFRFSVHIRAQLRDGRPFAARTDMAAFGAAEVQLLVANAPNNE